MKNKKGGCFPPEEGETSDKLLLLDNTKNAALAHKAFVSIVDLKVIEYIKENSYVSKDNKVGLSEASQALGHVIRLTKKEIFLYFKELEEKGLLTYVPYNFIVLKRG